MYGETDDIPVPESRERNQKFYFLLIAWNRMSMKEQVRWLESLWALDSPIPPAS